MWSARAAIAVVADGRPFASRAEGSRRPRMDAGFAGEFTCPASPAAAVGLDHEIDRAASHDQVLHIVAADQNKPPAGVERPLFDHVETLFGFGTKAWERASVQMAAEENETNEPTAAEDDKQKKV